MVHLQDLWLPILVSGIAVFFASFLVWAVLPLHSKDWKPVPNEDGFINGLKMHGLKKGGYAFPFCADKAQHKDPEFQRKWKEGPSGFLTVMGDMNMGKNMLLSFVVFLIASTFIAYVAGHALPAGTEYMKVFQIVGSMAIAVYTIARLPNDIWFQTPCRAVVMNLIDGVIYGLVTAGVFASMWPGPALPAVP